MKSFGLYFALAAAAGTLAAGAPGAFAQTERSSAPSAQARIYAACQVMNEAVQVQETLDRFASGLASHDVQQLQAAGIEPVSAKGWQRFFKSNPDATVADSCPVSSLFIAGDTANWSCIETSRITSDGRPVENARVIRFTFTKRNGEWMISDRR